MNQTIYKFPAPTVEPIELTTISGPIESRQPPRPPWVITLSVWKAIFLREALDRLFDVRAAWLWLIVEPSVHIAFISIIWAKLRARSMSSMDITIWIVVGLLSFFLFRRTAMQVMYAVDCNKNLFVYRQVKPFDAAIVRAVLESLLMAMITIFITYILALLGKNPLPYDPLLVMSALFGLWMFGLGFGLVSSVIMRLVPDLEHILKIIMTPLYLASGVIMPIASIPQPYRKWLLFNPIVHGLESCRRGFSQYYYPVPGLSLNYLFGSALILFGLGMLLYRRFNLALVTK